MRVATWWTLAEQCLTETENLLMDELGWTKNNLEKAKNNSNSYEYNFLSDVLQAGMNWMKPRVKGA